VAVARAGADDGGSRGASRRDDLVARILARHAVSLRAVARRHSLCEDDASDACQRALELFLHNADRLDPDGAYRWLHTVTKHEAMALRAERQRVLPYQPYDFDIEARHHPSPDDRVIESDDLRRVAEAMADLKPAEAQALVLKADGRSYAEIAGQLGWTRTKVNRCLAEGRARLRLRIAGIESGEECARWAPVLARLAEGGLAAPEVTAARSHLRGCGACRAQVRALHGGPAPLAVAPVGLVAFWVGLQERALGVVVRGQAVLDVLTTGKGVAVAASAAALASGGVAVVDRALEPPSRAVGATVRSLAAGDGGPSRARGAGPRGVAAGGASSGAVGAAGTRSGAGESTGAGGSGGGVGGPAGAGGGAGGSAGAGRGAGGSVGAGRGPGGSAGAGRAAGGSAGAGRGPGGSAGAGRGPGGSAGRSGGGSASRPDPSASLPPSGADDGAGAGALGGGAGSAPPAGGASSDLLP